MYVEQMLIPLRNTLINDFNRILIKQILYSLVEFSSSFKTQNCLETMIWN